MATEFFTLEEAKKLAQQHGINPYSKLDGGTPGVNICDAFNAAAAKALEKQQAEIEALHELLKKSKLLLDRYRLETPMGNQPHMITLEAYQVSNGIAAAMQNKE